MPSATDAYIKAAPAEQQPVLREIRDLIRAAFPQADETMGPNGFAVYMINGEWVAGFATRKKAPMLYVMSASVLDKHEQTLGKLRSGKSCIEYRSSKSLSLEELRPLAERILAEAAQVRA